MDWSSNFLSIILLIVLIFVLSNMYADFSDQFVSIDSVAIRKFIKVLKNTMKGQPIIIHNEDVDWFHLKGQ